MTRYRADPPALRPSVAAEGMTLLFHRPSGTTHVLLPPAPEILDVLAAGPADIATIAERLAAAHDMAPDDMAADEPIAAILEARLAELIEAGLVAAA